MEIMGVFSGLGRARLLEDEKCPFWMESSLPLWQRTLLAETLRPRSTAAVLETSHIATAFVASFCCGFTSGYSRGRQDSRVTPLTSVPAATSHWASKAASATFG